MKKTAVISIVCFFVLGNVLFSQTWSATQRLTWNSGWCGSPRVAAGSDNSLHMLWRDDTPGNSEVFYRKSTNNGNSWLASKRLTWTPEWSGDVWIALDSSNDPYIVWSEGIDSWNEHYDIFFRKSTDGGNTWSARKRLTWNSDWSYYPRIILGSNGHLHVIWTQSVSSNNAEIYYKKSTNGGAAWVSSQRLTNDSGYSDDTSIAVDSNNHIHIVWNDNKTGNYEIYFVKSTNGGASWDAIKRLSWTTSESFYPDIAVDPSDNLHVVWEDKSPGNYEIFYKKSTNGGNTWSTKRLTFNPGKSYEPKIAFGNNNNPKLAWYNEIAGYYQIMFKESTNGGTTWTGAERLTWTPVNNYIGSFVMDSGNDPHVFFGNSIQGNFEIYHKKRN